MITNPIFDETYQYIQAVNDTMVQGIIYPKNAASVTVDPSEVTIALDGSISISADTTSDGTIEWSTSNSEVASVEAGVISAVAVGEATVTASVPQTEVYDAASATVAVTVEKKTPTLTLSATAFTIASGSSDTLVATTNSDGDVSYVSSDEAVATIEDGTITAAAVGEATITVSVAETATYKAASATATVSVTE